MSYASMRERDQTPFAKPSKPGNESESFGSEIRTHSGFRSKFSLATGLPIFPLKASALRAEAHLKWAKKVMFKSPFLPKSIKKGNIGTFEPGSR